MQVKTFEGLSMKDVISQVKKQCGPDVVILSTKEKFSEKTGSKMIEVKAAIHEADNRPGASSTSLIENSENSILRNERLDVIERRLDYLSEKLASKQQFNNLEAGLKELKVLCINAMRTMPQANKHKIPSHLESVYQQLHLMCLDESYLIDILNHLESLPLFDEAKKDGSSSVNDYYRSHAIRYMFKKIKIYPPIKPFQGQSQIHLFVGGSGVGKTCTVAKIAAHFQKKEKSKVLLISFDNKKVASGELLPLYSKILGTNHVMIESADEIEKVILENRNCELILIDSMGGIPRNDEELKRLSCLLEKPLPIDVHLVLSLTENSMQMDRTINSFSPLGLHSVLFSKLDESWTFGEMYNVSCRWSIPLSFFTTGQKIPDDIEPASRERIIERLFGL